jgi:uncharacterized protein YegL
MPLFSFKSKSVSQNVASDNTLVGRALSFRTSTSRFQGQSNNLFSQPMRASVAAATRPFPQDQEPPPAYTPRKSLVLDNRVMSTTTDSPYAFLAQFDTIFLIDDSGSMAGRSWHETSAALAAITPICTQHDTDGIDIYFLNHRSALDTESGGAYKKLTRPAQIIEIFSSVTPRGGTPTGTRLSQILKPYLERVEAMAKGNTTANPDLIVKPLNIIVITDGVPSDDVESVIVNAATKLDRCNAQAWQIGIQFFQVGNEPEAAEELQELDDALSKRNGIRDMVDTVPWKRNQKGTLSADEILKVVLGAVHRKYDRRDASGQRAQK